MTTSQGADGEQQGSGSAGRSPRVRPYTITRGRTRTRSTLAIETLVETTLSRELRSLSHEQRIICEVCLSPVSVAEVSARTALPLGVVRVLLDDMVAEDLVVVHTPATDRPDRALMERVLDGLQRL